MVTFANGGMAIVEIRSKERCNISREDGIEIEALSHNCNGLTRVCLKYKSADRI